jgi:hypothetical protein
MTEHDQDYDEENQSLQANSHTQNLLEVLQELGGVLKQLEYPDESCKLDQF